MRACKSGLVRVVVCLLFVGLAPAVAQESEVLPGSGILFTGEEYRLTWAPRGGPWGGSTLTISIEPFADVDDALAQSGITIEFAPQALTDLGVRVSGRNVMPSTVRVTNDGSVELNGDPIGTAQPAPESDAYPSSRLTVVFSDDQAGRPTASEVSAVIAAVRIAIPADTEFEGNLLLRRALDGRQGQHEETTAPVVKIEPPSVIELDPPPGNSVSGSGLVVADAVGEWTEVSPGVECSGERCDTLRPYRMSADCDVRLREELPGSCVLADEDRDRRPELPALYSGVVWVVTDDEAHVLAMNEQHFYVAPVIGFEAGARVIPGDGAVRVGVSVSKVPGDASWSVRARAKCCGEEPADDEVGVVTLGAGRGNGVVEFTATAPGILTLEIASTQLNTTENYHMLDFGAPEDPDSYLYALGNDQVEIVEPQSELIRSGSDDPLPYGVSDSFTIPNFSVTKESRESTITSVLVEAGILGKPDAASVTATLSGGNLQVDFEAGYDPRAASNRGDIIVLSLVLTSETEAGSSTRTRSLLFPVVGTEQVAASTTLPVYGGEGARRSSEIRVFDPDVELMPGAYLLRYLGSRAAATFSPKDVEARDAGLEEDILPPPPSYNETGIFDFVARGLGPGDVVTVLIRLPAKVAGGARVSKYAPDDEGVFGWNPFTSNEDPGMPGSLDGVWSAPKTAGSCPAVHASRRDAWRSAVHGLRSGDECLLLQVQDGGPNDADGLANGVIYDPNAVTGGGGRRGSGGGVVDPLLLLALLPVLLARRRIRARTG